MRFANHCILLLCRFYIASQLFWNCRCSYFVFPTLVKECSKVCESNICAVWLTDLRLVKDYMSGFASIAVHFILHVVIMKKFSFFLC